LVAAAKHGFGLVEIAKVQFEQWNATVSRITLKLSNDIEALRSASIVDDIAYLYLDATFLKGAVGAMLREIITIELAILS
jgi:transposase-like protein